MRDLIPAYAFVICDLKRMDILIATQEFVFNNLINHDKEADYSIEDYKKHYSNKHASGSTKSISTNFNSKEKWKTLKNERGVIYTCSYVLD